MTDSSKRQAGRPHPASRYRRNQFALAVRDGGPVGLALFPMGIAFGLLITQMGFAWWWAPIFSIVIYAGSMEFLAITMVTGAVGPFSAALYTFLVNFRHVFYGISYPNQAVHNRLAMTYAVYTLTDEVYAIVASRRGVPWTQMRIITIHAILQTFWVLGGITGGLAGAIIPEGLEGMEFALTALFVVLLVEAWDANRNYSMLLTAIVAGIIGMLVSPDNMLLIGMLLYCAVLLGRYIIGGERADSLNTTKTAGKKPEQDRHPEQDKQSGRAGETGHADETDQTGKTNQSGQGESGGSAEEVNP